MIKPINSTEREIINSPEFKRSWDYGKVRPNHPEGNVGRHIEMILEYIEKNYKNDIDYEKLRLLALLHDIGKCKGYTRPHSTNSVEIAKKFINVKVLHKPHTLVWGYFKHPKVPNKPRLLSRGKTQGLFDDKELLELILIHDYPWSFFKKWEKGEFDLSRFISTFRNTNWRLLIKFRYCDNCNRGQEPSDWFKEKCYKLLTELI